MSLLIIPCSHPLGPFIPRLLSTDCATAVVKEYSEKNPNIFGAHGGYSRAYSIGDVAAAVAMMLGPIISGSLHQLIGYYYMNLTFGMGISPGVIMHSTDLVDLATALVILSVLSFRFLEPGQLKQDIPSV